jgi:hypothetical protein
MREHRRQLDAGVEASGPHDFAVRFRAVRPLAAKTSTASRPTFVTMANAPLIGRDGRICRRDLPDKLNEIFLRKRLDRPDIQPIDLPVGQISVASRLEAFLLAVHQATARVSKGRSKNAL